MLVDCFCIPVSAPVGVVLAFIFELLDGLGRFWLRFGEGIGKGLADGLRGGLERVRKCSGGEFRGSF